MKKEKARKEKARKEREKKLNKGKGKGKGKEKNTESEDEDKEEEKETEEEDKSRKIPVKLPQKTKAFFRCLGSESPVCTYLFPSSIELIKELTEVDFKKDRERYHALQMESPIFYDLLWELKDLSRLPKEFTSLLQHLIMCAETPFNNPEHRLPNLPLDDERKLERLVLTLSSDDPQKAAPYA